MRASLWSTCQNIRRRQKIFRHQDIRLGHGRKTRAAETGHKAIQFRGVADTYRVDDAKTPPQRRRPLWQWSGMPSTSAVKRWWRIDWRYGRRWRGLQISRHRRIAFLW
jgi:hypothetical protein